MNTRRVGCRTLSLSLYIYIFIYLGASVHPLSTFFLFSLSFLGNEALPSTHQHIQSSPVQSSPVQFSSVQFSSNTHIRFTFTFTFTFTCHHDPTKEEESVPSLLLTGDGWLWFLFRARGGVRVFVLLPHHPFPPPCCQSSTARNCTVSRSDHLDFFWRLTHLASSPCSTSHGTLGQYIYIYMMLLIMILLANGKDRGRWDEIEARQDKPTNSSAVIDWWCDNSCLFLSGDRMSRRDVESLEMMMLSVLFKTANWKESCLPLLSSL